MFRSASYKAGHCPWHRRLILPNTLTRTILACKPTLDWFLFGYFTVKYTPIIWHRITLKVRQQLLKLAWQFWCSNLIAGLYLIAFNFRPTFKKIEKEKLNMLLCNSPNYTNCTNFTNCANFYLHIIKVDSRMNTHQVLAPISGNFIFYLCMAKLSSLVHGVQLSGSWLIID